jgi:hypothetical protein
MAGMLALVGCGKSDKPQSSAVVEVWDMGPVREAFPSPSAEVNDSLSKLILATRYRQPEPVIVELDNLAKIPGLTEAQKKVINAKIEQLKQAVTDATAKPPQ